MGEFLAFLGLFTVLAGFVSLVYPLSFLKIKNRKTAVGVILGGIVIMAVAGSMLPDSSLPNPSSPGGPPSGAAETSSRSSSPPTEPKKPNLELVEHYPATGEFGVRTIEGKVRNNSNRTYGYVQIQINLYDAEGNQVGSTMDNCNNLEPNSTWKFSAPVIEDSTARYQIKDVTGF